MSGSSFIPHPWGLIIILQELLQSLPFIQAVRILALNETTLADIARYSVTGQYATAIDTEY
jgi:hypothetical protein